MFELIQLFLTVCGAMLLPSLVVAVFAVWAGE